MMCGTFLTLSSFVGYVALYRSFCPVLHAGNSIHLICLSNLEIAGRATYNIDICDHTVYLTELMKAKSVKFFVRFSDFAVGRLFCLIYCLIFLNSFSIGIVI